MGGKTQEGTGLGLWFRHQREERARRDQRGGLDWKGRSRTGNSGKEQGGAFTTGDPLLSQLYPGEPASQGWGLIK